MMQRVRPFLSIAIHLLMLLAQSLAVASFYNPDNEGAYPVRSPGRGEECNRVPLYAKDLPVCVVGGGISGLVIANKLTAAKVPVILLDRQFDHIGGKMHSKSTWGAVWERGPGMVATTQPHIARYLNDFNVKTTPWSENNFGLFDIDVANAYPVKRSDLDALNVEWQAKKRNYTAAWNKYPNWVFSPGGYANLTLLVDNPKLVDIFGTAGSWLYSNELCCRGGPYADRLFWIVRLFLISMGYGTTNDFPALYILKFLTPDFMDSLIRLVTGDGRRTSDFLAPKNGFAELSYHMANKIKCIFLGHNVVRLRRQTQNYGYIKIDVQVERTQLSYSRDCSRVVFAFPPLIGKMVRLLPDIGDTEKLVFDAVRVHKFFSSGHLINDEKRKKIGDLNLYSGGTAQVLLGDGRPVTLSRSTNNAQANNNAYTLYSWLHGKYGTAPNPEDLGIVDDDMRAFVLQFTSYEPPKVSFLDGYEHFPHIWGLDSGGMANVFDKFANGVQGGNLTYYATTVSSFDSLDGAIENAEAVADLILKPLRGM